MNGKACLNFAVPLAIALMTAGCNGGSNASTTSSPKNANTPAYWEGLPPSLLKRLEVFGTQVGRSVYVIGGYEEQRLGVFGAAVPYEVSPIPSSAVERYDLDTGMWGLVSPMPIHLDHARAVEYQGKLYVTGGNDALAVAMPFFWQYDPATDAWTQMPNMPLPAAAHTSAVVGDKLIVVGGYIFPLDRVTVQVFDFKSQTWSSGPGLPVPDDHAMGTALDGYMYVVGGRPNDFLQGMAYHQVYRWNPNGDAGWEQLADLPQTRSGGGAVAVCGRIVAISGEDPHENPRQVRHSVEIYDPRRNVWSELPPIPTPRHGLVAVADGNRIYTFEGGDHEVLGYTNAVERLTLNCNAVANLPPSTVENGPGGTCLPDEVPAAGGHCPAAPGGEAPGTLETIAPQLVDVEEALAGGSDLPTAGDGTGASPLAPVDPVIEAVVNLGGGDVAP